MYNPVEHLAKSVTTPSSSRPSRPSANQSHGGPGFWRRPAALLLLGSLVSGYAYAQIAFGPRPIYVQAGVLKWQLGLNRDRNDVFAAAIKAGEKLELVIASQDDEAGLLVLTKSIGKGMVLDEHCSFPIINYYSWRPMATFAETQRRLIQKRNLAETATNAGALGASIRVSLQVDSGGSSNVESLCFADRQFWGSSSGRPLPYLPEGMRATSKGLLEKPFLEGMLKELGLSGKIEIPAFENAEPARTDPTRDLTVARDCPAGVVVDQTTHEIRCPEPARE